MLTLTSDTLTAVVDPAHGARIASLVVRATNRELLFRTPWPTGDPPASPADETAWTTAWPGGWDVLFPNAGGACVVDGRAHGFHGGASLGAWQADQVDDATAVLTWRDEGGLRLARRVAVEGALLTVSNDVVNEGEAAEPFILSEHLIFGEAIAHDTRLAVERALVTPLADEGHPICDTTAWPRVGRGDGDETWATASAPASRFGVLSDVAGSAIRAEGREGHAVEVAWHGLPYLWLWHEQGAADSWPDGRRIVCLGLEPAMTSHSQGLDAALRGGQATVLAPGARWRSATVVRLLA